MLFCRTVRRNDSIDSFNTDGSSLQGIYESAKPRRLGHYPSTRKRNGKLQRHILFLAAIEPGLSHVDYCEKLSSRFDLKADIIAGITYAPSHYLELVKRIGFNLA